MKKFTYALGGGINRSPEFQKKGLAEYAVNVGLRCGHDCTYCSSRAMLRCHTAFQELGRNAFGTGYSIVDPAIPDKVAQDAKRLRQQGLVQICTTVDAWAPEARELHLGRRYLEAILRRTRLDSANSHEVALVCGPTSAVGEANGTDSLARCWLLIGNGGRVLHLYASSTSINHHRHFRRRFQLL